MKKRHGFVLLIFGALILAACGSSKGSTQGAGTTVGTSAPTSSGTSGASATESPILIGLQNQEGGTTGSALDLRIAVEAGVKYVNAQGGVDGHPLKLVHCATQGTPESSASCANTLIADKPLLVLGGVDVTSAASVPLYQQADVPYIGNQPESTPDYTSPGAIMLAGGAASQSAALAEYAASIHLKNVAVIYVDVPTGKQAAEAVVAPLKSAAIKSELIPASVTASDFTPYTSLAATSGAQAVITLYQPSGCSAVMQAAGSTGLTAKLMFLGVCTEADVLQAGGAGANNSIFSADNDVWTDASNPEATIYRNAMKQYAPGQASNFKTVSGFSLVMDVTSALKAIGPAKFSGPAVLAYFHNAKNVASFMSAPYTCNGKAIPGLTAVCNAASYIYQYSGGVFKTLKKP